MSVSLAVELELHAALGTHLSGVALTTWHTTSVARGDYITDMAGMSRVTVSLSIPKRARHGSLGGGAWDAARRDGDVELSLRLGNVGRVR